MTKFHKGNLSHGEFFTLQRVTVAVEEARRIDRWSAERAELGNNTTPLVCVPGGPEKQYMWGRTWLPQTPPSKINKTNLSLYFGNFEVSALKGIFYLVTESDAARKQLPGFPKPPFERSPFSFFFAFSWLSKSLLSHCSCQLTVSVVTFCHISFFGGETFDKLKDVICWRSSGYRDSAAPWIINVDANLSPNSKLKIPLNNEWISETDLISTPFVCTPFPGLGGGGNPRALKCK